MELLQISNKTDLSFKEQSKILNKSVAPTKVKSGSWKRSDKTISPYNTLSNKKRKNIRKNSRSNGKIQGSDKLINSFEPTSVCRPGTLYSDVLFGAGCSSNLVKIKNSTPKHCNISKTSSTAQKKLSKALFKLSDHREYETSDESEIEDKKKLFPALEKVQHKISSETIKPTSSSKAVKNKNSQEKLEKIELTTDITPSTNPPKLDLTEKSEAGFKSPSSINQNEVIVNNYEQNFQYFIHNLESGPDLLCKNNTFFSSLVSNIPEWNFTNVDTSSDAFPKFSAQFDDDRYLEAEKMASLSLKLAMGNNSMETKHKF